MGFLVFYLLFSWRWALLVSFSVGIIGVLSVYLSQKIEWIWLQLARLLGKIIPNVLLAIVFYLVLFPVAIVYRLFKRDPLMLSNKQDSFFVVSSGTSDRNNLKKMW